MNKNLSYLTPTQAVEAGFFASEKTAANMRSEGIGPRYFKPEGGRVYYRREDLEAWMQAGMVNTISSLPYAQRTGIKL